MAPNRHWAIPETMMTQFNSLWPSDTILQHRSGSTLVQVMARCSQATNHHLNQCCPSSSADSRFAPRQWETALLCNDVSHWLGASLESTLSSIVPFSVTRQQWVKGDDHYHCSLLSENTSTFTTQSTVSSLHSLHKLERNIQTLYYSKTNRTVYISVSVCSYLTLLVLKLECFRITSVKSLI